MAKNKTKKTPSQKQTPQRENIKTPYRIGALVLAGIIIISMIAMYTL